ncbi:MAG: L-threonylcarbamoyladenylate synthase [Patescibacteria group bacterium]|nr:L-threonylcarbamoyladenylate synthase [Patescibacteria group bacterium]
MEITDQVVAALRQGGVGVLPSDTLYGLMGLATSRQAVERIYRLKGREATQPSIILIGDIADLTIFGVELDTAMRAKLERLWPARVSIILPVKHNFDYLVQGPLKTHAFRIPPQPQLRALLQQVGPLVAPSANFSGQPPAKDIVEAKGYFGDQVDFYVDGGTLVGEPSSVVLVEALGGITIKRAGADLDKVRKIFMS